MPHPLVLQLRFTRSEFKRAASKISEEDAQRRIMPMNSVSWTIGHLAWQEQRYFIYFPTGEYLLPDIQERYAFGSPHSTPPAREMWRAYRRIIRTADDVRKIMGHTGIGYFVGDIDGRAPYTPEKRS